MMYCKYCDNNKYNITVICVANSITNKLTNKSCLTSGGKCFTTDTMYAAEYMKHNLINVGHGSQKLSGRFDGHCSDQS